MLDSIHEDPALPRLGRGGARGGRIIRPLPTAARALPSPLARAAPSRSSERARGRRGDRAVPPTVPTSARWTSALRDVGGGEHLRASASGRRFLRRTWMRASTTEEAVARLRGMPEVAYAERNGRVRAPVRRLTPNDQFFRAQWHMRLIGRRADLGHPDRRPRRGRRRDRHRRRLRGLRAVPQGAGLGQHPFRDRLQLRARATARRTTTTSTAPTSPRPSRRPPTTARASRASPSAARSCR